MAYTYDTTTDVGKVRLMIQDIVEADAIFTDDAEIEVFLELMGSVISAAGMACMVIASNKTLLAQSIKTLNWTEDNESAAKSWQYQSSRFFELDPQYDYAEEPLTDFNLAKIMLNKSLRS